MKLSSEYEEKHLKFGRMDIDKNEITVPGVESEVLMIDGGFTGYQASFYSGEWDESQVREWIDSNIYELESENQNTQNESNEEVENIEAANEASQSSDDKIDL